MPYDGTWLLSGVVPSGFGYMHAEAILLNISFSEGRTSYIHKLRISSRQLPQLLWFPSPSAAFHNMNKRLECSIVE